jgi:hypothetical protein
MTAPNQHSCSRQQSSQSALCEAAHTQPNAPAARASKQVCEVIHRADVDVDSVRSSTMSARTRCCLIWERKFAPINWHTVQLTTQ